MESCPFYLSFYNNEISREDFDGLVNTIKDAFKNYSIKYKECRWDEKYGADFQMKGSTGRDTWNIIENISAQYPEVEFVYDEMELHCATFEDGEGNE